ncbi:MAG TPA: sigma-70 family RNA polymerase sigma factor, partial [Bacteroidales bacterium]|nr:sigma-70 family RNA polymerase sigma factor [Bacteroidales bacterium]
MGMTNEGELINALRDPKTCRQAFATVVSEYSERLYWQIRKMVLVHEDVDDILQDTFIKAWTNIDNFRGDSKLSTWLYRIAINESITFLNKKRKQNNVS